MPTQTTNLFLLEDLEDPSRTSKLSDSDLASLRAVTNWINTFITQPHKDLGRTGPVCPFVPGSVERKALWLAPEQHVGTPLGRVRGPGPRQGATPHQLALARSVIPHAR